MKDEQISARGERAAIGGYLPQFDAFAWFAYTELVNSNLEWIKVADPEAEKLDDIQYSTFAEVHAYQVKWSIADAKITFSSFKSLFPLISDSWKKIKILPSSINKKVVPHLLTNKPLSKDDNIKVGDLKIGTFTDFYHDAWLKLKIGQAPDSKWEPIIKELKETSKLNDFEFNDFVECFDFQPEYQPKKFSVEKTSYSQEDEDLEKFSRFILEKVADPNRQVPFTTAQIIKGLGWENRFKTTFNHDLVVDKKKYQPIHSTLNLLSERIEEVSGGYIFLLGGPGTGKSTLLTQWSKNRKDRIIKYYAFDFTNPSSHLNFHERGNSTFLFFDLVFQLKEAGIYEKKILPYKDLIYLRAVFFEQLAIAGEEFKKTGRKTILIIDGLDHVPREYKSTSSSFLRELPLPALLPEGVYIVLGSQSYELEDIELQIKKEYKEGNRKIQIDPLQKKDVYQYLESSNINPSLSKEQQSIVFEKTKGHPLYLSYLVERIRQSSDQDLAIEAFAPIGGEIDNYYHKIWQPIEKDSKLVELLGLLSRINGAVNPSFVKEWGFDQSVLRSFKERAKFLFNETKAGWTFFHNSFRQFLLINTAINYLTDERDSAIEIDFHNKLSGYYRVSQVEPIWHRNYHIFRAGKYDEFVSEVTPESFTSQLLEFRPIEEIREDVKLGIEIARRKKDITILVRYLFALAEIEKRLFNFDPATFTEDLLALNKATIAINYIRTENSLRCSEEYALKASRFFAEFGDHEESYFLFNMAYPDVVEDSSIVIDDSHRYEEVRDILDEWVYMAPYFIDIEKIQVIINNIKFLGDPNRRHFQESESSLRLRLLDSLSYSLIQSNKWGDLKKVVKEFNQKDKEEANLLFPILQAAIEECIDLGDNNLANEFLTILLTHSTKESISQIGRIYIADLLYKVRGDIIKSCDWIVGLPQPTNIGKDRLSYNGTLDPFFPLIKFNKLLNISRNGVSIQTAIPPALPGTDEEILVEFERMICLITQIASDDNQKVSLTSNLINRIHPIARFYYKDISHHNRYWFYLKQANSEYFDLLINAVSLFGQENLKKLGNFLFDEFSKYPEYWSASLQREIIKSLFTHGYDSEKLKKQLVSLESFMFVDHDIDGRINQCIAHSRVWLRLGEPTLSEKWIKQSIQESIGIGYRKDYQFSTWIDWLIKTNEKESEKASERIKWFLSHLSHIKESTEGKAYWDASEKLLKATFEWNFSAGFDQLQWQLNNGLIDFEDALVVFIEGYVERVASEDEYKYVVQLYTEVLLFISETSGPFLLKQILNSGYSLLKKQFLKTYLPILIDSINIKCIEEKRIELLSAIEEFASLMKFPIEDFCPNFEISSNVISNRAIPSNLLKLKNGHEELSEEAVMAKVYGFESFKLLLQEEDQSSFFNWSKVIDKVLPLLSITEICEISTLNKSGRRDSDFYAKLSDAVFKLGDKEVALTLANKSLELSSESGWVRHFDGGTRLNAFKVFKKINPQESSSKAFEVFSHDIISGSYSGSYIEYLDDIIPLLTEDYNVTEIWPEISGYLKRLMSNSAPKQNLPEIIAEDKSIIEIYISYLVFLHKNPVRLIKERSAKLLALIVDDGNIYALDHLLKANTACHSEVEILNDVMMHLLAIQSGKLIEFKSIASQLAVSKNYLIRKNAGLVLLYLGEKVPMAQRIKLPEIYNLHLGESRRLYHKKELDPYFPELDLNNPEDIIRPFEYYIKVLSKQSKIDISILIYRVHSIMKDIGEPEEWTAKYEKELRRCLGDVNLKYPYPSARVITARNAIMHLVTELLDSGSINTERDIRQLFIVYDYAVPFYSEIPKPDFIQKLKEDGFSSIGDEWLDKIEDHVRLYEELITYKDKLKIIGEYSIVKSLDWGAPTEIYMSQVAISEIIEENDNFIFGSAFHQLTEDYYDLEEIEPSIIVVRSHRFEQFNSKATWLAINPELAKHFGWEPEPKKLFGWKDRDGNLMAESIYWLNGNVDMQPRKDSETGEGWFVVVSEIAWEQIKSVSKKLYIQKALSRTRWKNARPHKRATARITQCS